MGVTAEDLWGRVATARRQAQVNGMRLEETKVRLQETRERLSNGRSEREILHDSALARLLARLESQAVIEQAKGVLMAQRGCGPAEAFDVLRRASQRTNVPVRELASDIVRRVSEGREPLRPAADVDVSRPQAPRGRTRPG